MPQDCSQFVCVSLPREALVNFEDLKVMGIGKCCDVDTMTSTYFLNPTSAARWNLPDVLDLAPQTLNIWPLRSGVSGQSMINLVQDRGGDSLC